ncbi:hypothetical protein TcWFU_006897 [Taenia crassiceps]|uniref:Uncharacterized protein n=1 Tax=Taenia crassiceps TaxID=6207 RepID=A0ABR4QBL2_9CEST
MARNRDPDQLAKAILKEGSRSDEEDDRFLWIEIKKSSHKKKPDSEPREWMQRAIDRCGGLSNFGGFGRTELDKYLRDRMQFTRRIQAKHEAALKHLHQLYGSSKM